ncbi:hypothetical protein B9Z19DRAFT_1134817 [Tuber borchii]|uniref:NB-ARC domain-containing protein n=1 Tax=Tuber borchii TaxID=42251 RepID=A0A2T6ZDS1_TUBBO|nr:hypothetical protein B9Z19DRAFT_1134817 [Tuber borchii]
MAFTHPMFRYFLLALAPQTWAPATSEVLKFSEDFRAIAQHVRIPPASAETDETELLLSVRRWFEGSTSGGWILVIDNADNEADFFADDSPIAKFIPQGINGTLIITTRSRQVALQLRCEMIETSLKDKEKEDVPAILDSVDHLPLAVIGSAAYMFENGTPPSSYLAILQENEERMKSLLSYPFYGIQREARAKSILSTYFVTFDQIRQQMPLAADLLRVMAFFNHQNIPEELLAQCIPERMEHSANFRCAIGKPSGFSLVKRDKYGKKFYQLDRLAQLSLQAYLPTKELNQGRTTALKVISRLFPQPQDGPRGIDPAYIPHALAATRDSTDPIAEELGFCVALHLLDIRSYDSAEIQFRGCTALREECKE